jgi:hypothetical protein
MKRQALAVASRPAAMVMEIPVLCQCHLCTVHDPSFKHARIGPLPTVHWLALPHSQLLHATKSGPKSVRSWTRISNRKNGSMMSKNALYWLGVLVRSTVPWIFLPDLVAFLQLMKRERESESWSMLRVWWERVQYRGEKSRTHGSASLLPCASCLLALQNADSRVPLYLSQNYYCLSFGFWYSPNHCFFCFVSYVNLRASDPLVTWLVLTSSNY